MNILESADGPSLPAGERQSAGGSEWSDDPTQFTERPECALPSPKSTNSRRHPRYPLSVPCILERPNGNRVLGIVVDLSLGGVCLHTTGSVQDLHFFTLEVIEPGFELHLICETREVRDLWDRRVVHAQFAQVQLEALDEAVKRAQQRQVASHLQPPSFRHRLLKVLFRDPAAT
ncbi:MAG: PilZ domain-containing protein [Vicinamibacteria bacterium]